MELKTEIHYAQSMLVETPILNFSIKFHYLTSVQALKIRDYPGVRKSIHTQAKHNAYVSETRF